jgi:hypothetical protein
LSDISAVLNESTRGRKRGNGRAAPPIAKAGVVEAGREAWQRRKDDAHVCWEDWVLIGKALLAGRAHAMTRAGKKQPRGKAYTLYFSNWLQAHHFHDIDKADRGKAMWTIEKLDELEAFRDSLPEADRQRLNHPSAVWRAWKCPNRGGRWRDQQARAAETHDDGANTTARAHEFEHDAESEGALLAGPLIVKAGPLVLKANKAAGLADDCRQFAGKVDGAILRAVREAAEAWADILDLFEARSRELQEEA